MTLTEEKCFDHGRHDVVAEPCHRRRGGLGGRHRSSFSSIMRIPFWMCRHLVRVHAMPFIQKRSPSRDGDSRAGENYPTLRLMHGWSRRPDHARVPGDLQTRHMFGLKLAPRAFGGRNGAARQARPARPPQGSRATSTALGWSHVTSSPTCCRCHGRIPKIPVIPLPQLSHG